MGIFSDTIKIQWKHFGHKFRLSLTKEDLNAPDLFEVLMKKVNAEVPNFDGLIACLDFNNRQLIIKNDNDLRKAIERTKDKLKIYSTLPERGSLPAVDFGANRVCRSYSVPPKNYQAVNTNSQQPNPNSTAADPEHQAESPENNAPGSARQHTPLSRSNRSNSSFIQRNRHSFRSALPPPTGQTIPMAYPMYHQSYSSYNNAPGSVPPINMMLNHVLTGGRYPPFGPARPFIF